MIMKSADSRITVVGKNLFNHLIDSQSHPTPQINFPKVKNLRLIRFNWRISFVACNFILTPNNDFFLEENVSGNIVLVRKFPQPSDPR